MLARQIRFTSLVETTTNRPHTLFSHPPHGARQLLPFSTSASTHERHTTPTVTGPPLNRPHLRLQYAARGQNLSDRYKRLEKSLRGKQELESEIRDFEAIEESGLEKATPREEHLAMPSGSGARKTGKEVVETFYGFKIPKEPQPPGDDECCMSGCAICIYDLYDDSLEEYRKSVSTLRASLRTMKVPEGEWPVSLREKKAGPGGEKEGEPERKSAQEVTLNAFEEMERALAAKAQTASQKSSGTDSVIDASSILQNRRDTSESMPSATPALEAARAKRRNAIPPPPPPTFKERMVELKEGIRWALFSNR